MPKDVLKFTNKLFGLCQGITIKQKVCSTTPHKLTIEVLRNLLNEQVIQNDQLLQILNEGRITDYDQLQEMQVFKFDIEKAKISMIPK
jgi:hypothetical protein